MMSKHTPGPWKVLDRTLIVTTEPWITVCVGSEKEMVAMMNMEDPSIRPGPNARLIAAAPDLLEALKLARSIIGHPDDAHSKLIDAAIKKAEGL